MCFLECLCFRLCITRGAIPNHRQRQNCAPEQPGGGGVHGSSGALSVASDVLPQHQSGGPLIPSISCRSTVSDTEYEKVSAIGTLVSTCVVSVGVEFRGISSVSIWACETYSSSNLATCPYSFGVIVINR